MCGILGVFNYSNRANIISEPVLKKMTDEIRHRGPDDDGLFISPDRRVGFGFRRLAIIDLSPLGHQPMQTPDERITLVFNGEIYNHKEIRKDLESKGYRYRSQSDTETILYAYQEYGEAFITKLYGMFGIAIWDAGKEELLLIRDRIGIKPLYYTFQNGVLYFASEIKAILKHPAVSKKLHPQGLSDYLTLLTTPPGETMFEGIYKLEAGDFMRVDKHGAVQTKKYWDLTHRTETFQDDLFHSEAFCVEHIRRLLRSSIELRMMSDVPFGVLLSGGVDSSVNVALMAERMTQPVQTFSVGFKDLEKYNELGYARQIASQFKTNHHEVLIDERDAINFLPKMIWHQDEPNADPVCVPLYFVSKLARESGTIVVQVGEGSDEEFAGYTSYQRELNYYRYFYSLLPKALHHVGHTLYKSYQPSSLITDYLRRASTGSGAFYGGAVSVHESMKQGVLTEKFQRGRLSAGRIAGKYMAALDGMLSGSKSDDFLRQMIYVEFKSRLAELLLMRVDKMSMAVSIEARVPFLDHRLVEFAFRIPASLKIKNGVPKYIMKKAAEGIIPDSIIYRKKQGFAAPVSEWLRSGNLSRYAKDRVMSSGLIKTHVFNAKTVAKMFEQHTSGKRNLSGQLWTLLVASMWYDLHFPHGD
ncbi:MAG: asparagine synthase (glutamine-hydrolyzing) [Rhizobacter sp.]|nr:asparagine synthase (glutamine-hydrolyzing) [Chlorobiales bacterium]